MSETIKEESSKEGVGDERGGALDGSALDVASAVFLAAKGGRVVVDAGESRWCRRQ